MSLKDEDENSDQYKFDLLSALSTDMPASDCLVSLFWSALSNYRHDTVLRPFPSQYILTDGTKDVDGLRAVFKDLPLLTKIHKQLDTVDNQVLKLLHWITHNKTFSLHSKPVSEFSYIENQTPGSTHSTKPHAIFEFKYTPEKENKWQELSKNYGSFLAYHGTRVENFHCIAHIGLLSHMNKTGLFGEGTYLSTDLGVCMNFSPSANVWINSLLPPLCSMVAVCEVVDHPEIRSRVQVGGEPSLNQKIPERYFVVTNDQLLRLKYILVFAQERARPRPSQHWMYRHKWTILVIIYISLLLLIGLWKSRYVSKLFYQYTRKHLTI